MGSSLRLRSLVFVVVVVGVVELNNNLAFADLEKDKEECTDQLVGLAPCLPYVGGEAKTPTIDCCSGLKQVLDKSMKCICILIKDRNDPNLGITINASLAVHLPSTCHTPTNISKCVDLLHLPPTSSDAKVFEGFDKATRNNASTPVPPTGSNSGKGSGSSNSTSSLNSDAKNEGVSLLGLGNRKRWVVTQAFSLILPFIFIYLG